MDPVWGLAIVALLTAVIGPVTLAHLQGKQQLAAKLEDWRRQDEVAARAAEVAKQLLAKQEETAQKTREAAELLVENNKVVAETAEITNGKLDQIHTLVNSNMTEALQSELDSVRAQLAMMRELITFKVAQGVEPSEETAATLKALEIKAQKLAANLKDRLEQTKIADAQIFIAKETAIKKKET